jgi:uncharacterized glyoxalase superfamily protein PhnB
MGVRPGIIVALVYADAPRAIDFLCDAFGFTRHLVFPGDDPAQILHAQLVLDGCMVMLSTATPEGRARYGMVPPGQTGGLVNSCLCVVLDDPDAHHAHAVAAGAPILFPPHDNPYGGRGYEARDPEGNVWTFSSYDPWA